MATYGPTKGGTFANDSSGGGDAAWASPANAETSNNTYTTATCNLGAESHYLVVTNFGFVVSGTVNGITVEFERNCSQGAIVDREIRLVVDGLYAGTDKSAGATWPGSDATATFGGAADLWGLTPTDTQINDSTFGCAIRCMDSAFDESIANIDQVRITITYTPPGGGGPVSQSKLVNGSLLLRGLIR